MIPSARLLMLVVVLGAVGLLGAFLVFLTAAGGTVSRSSGRNQRPNDCPPWGFKMTKEIK